MTLERIGSLCVEGVRRWLPDPFVFALLLTLITGASAMVWVGASPLDVATGWYDGFWMLLEFGMQMVLILATGYAIALSTPVTGLIDRMAARITSPGQVYLVVLVAGGLLVFVSWGWVVLTAVLARELASRVKGIDYAYLIAATYLSSNAWVVGLSSSIPLLLNTPGNFLIENGLLSRTIPVGQTLGSPLNLAVAAVYLVVSPAAMWLMRPRSTVVELDDLVVDSADSKPTTVAEDARTLLAADPALSDRLNTSVVLQTVVALMGLTYVAVHFVRNGFDLNLNLMIFVFLMLGLVLHGTPIRGIMLATGLGKAIALWMSSVATLETIPAVAYVTGGIVNFSIPSAGGEWAVLGPPLVDAVRELTGGLGPAAFEKTVARVAMAVAYGESLTNLLQPFFLLTVLPVMGAGVKIQARDLMGYVLVPFAVLFVTIGLLVALVPVG